MHPEVPNYLLKALSEIFGTAILVFVGCMTCVFGLGETREAALLNISIGFGLAVALAIAAFGCITLAHINPAVTLAFVILRLISLPLAAVYVVAQCIGSILGFALLSALTPYNEAVGAAGLCTNVLNPKLSIVEGLFVETVITTFLIWAVCAAFHPRNSDHFDSLAIRLGLAVWVLALAAIPYTSAGLNPARSLGPAIINNYYYNLWIFWVGPLLGSTIAATSYKFAFIDNVPSPPKMVDEDVGGGDTSTIAN